MRSACAFFFLSGFLLSSLALAAGEDRDKTLPDRAIEKSQLTLPGSTPFHLKAGVVELTNRHNDSYNAEIEEYWLSPDKWKLTVTSGGFSETLIANGGKTSESLTGDYFPNWLRTLVTAIFDPREGLRGLDMNAPYDNPIYGGGGPLHCRRFAFHAGIPPVWNNVFSTYCFRGGLLESVGKPGYSATYQSYKKFGEKSVARKIREYIESGTELEARITELEPLVNPDEALFLIQEPNAPLRTLLVNEETVRKIALQSPDMQWPPVKEGKLKGVLSLYVCIDRNGQVRETYGLNSDNPFMTDAARRELGKWRFKPAVDKSGAHVQIESILTFEYDVRKKK